MKRRNFFKTIAAGIASAPAILKAQTEAYKPEGVKPKQFVATGKWTKPGPVEYEVTCYGGGGGGSHGRGMCQSPGGAGGGKYLPYVSPPLVTTGGIGGA